MMRWLITLLFLAGLAVAGDWLFQHPGTVEIDWMGYAVTLHIAILALLLLMLMAVVAILSVWFWRIATWPSRRRARIKHRTFQRGLDQLTRGVTALAMGEDTIAEEALKKALVALPGEPLPQLLTAQLLQRQGKHADAQVQFRALMNHTLTAELATRRLIEQHVERQEWIEAAKLAEEARNRSPRDRWLVLTLIDLYARAGDTGGMLALTEGWQWQSPLAKDERNRYAGLAYYLAAQAATNPRKKEQFLRHAVGYAPAFLPAVSAYAYVMIAQGSPRSARKWLLSAWKANPATVLIAPILASFAHLSPRVQGRLLRPFMRGNQTVAHHLLAARQAMMVDAYAQARTALEEALTLEENKEAILLMAEVERELRSDEAANSWLARAVQAPAGPSWICADCGAAHAEWQSHCAHCTHFDSLRFERPEARITSVELRVEVPNRSL